MDSSTSSFGRVKCRPTTDRIGKYPSVVVDIVVIDILVVDIIVVVVMKFLLLFLVCIPHRFNECYSGLVSVWKVSS